MQATQTKAEALAAYLDEDVSEDDTASWDENVYQIGNREYLVLTDDEADEYAKRYIEESVWAFNASFLVSYLPEGVGEEVIEALQPQCEDANEAIRSMIGDRFDEFVEDAISTDGRGHFMNSYDGYENEQGDFYIYRLS